MISSVTDLSKLLKSTVPLYAQYAQAHRKPRWVPVAKSKIFRIPKRPVISNEEKIELRRINNNYNTQMRAIRQFYYDEMIKEKSSRESSSSDENLRLEAEEWERCLALNEQWNVQINIEREARRQQEFEDMKQYALTRMEMKDKELQKNIEIVSAEIRKQTVCIYIMLQSDR